MSDFPINAPVETSPLAGADEVIVRRQGAPAASRAPASSMPVSTAVAQALDVVASNAAADATTKSNAAQAAAASDATAKANAAQAAAATDATTKANAAQAAAIAAAATDATTKANNARDSANQTALNTYVPLSQRGANNGVATLDATGKVPAIQLPSFVDDVLEFATLAAFPPTGETGKIYIAINGANASNPTKQYRWSGTAYSEITSSPGSTDAVAEGTTNRYFTEERVNLTQITGLVLNVITTIANGDTLRVALGKLQGQLNDAITNFASRVRSTTLDGISFVSDAQVTATTIIRDAIGRLQAQVNGKLGRRVGDGTDMTFGNVGDLQLVQRQGTQFIGVDSLSDTSFTLATRPPPAGVPDDVIRLKGVGNARSVWQESNGVNWGMQNGHAVIWLDSFPASKALTPMTGALVDLPDSYTLPGNLLNENSQVRIRPRFVSANPTATNQVQVLVNGSPVYESSAGSWFQQTGEIRFNNLGAMNAQEFFGPGTTGTGLGNSNSNQYSNPAGSPGSLRTFDTTADLTITFKAVGASGTSIKLAGFVLEVFDR